MIVKEMIIKINIAKAFILGKNVLEVPQPDTKQGKILMVPCGMVHLRVELARPINLHRHGQQKGVMK